MSKHRLLLLLSDRQTERLLKDYLSTFELISLPQQSIAFANIAKENFDLVILDEETFTQHHSELSTWRQSIEPLFMPTLLLMHSGGINVLSEDLRKQIDAFVIKPVSPAELDINLATLLQTRQLSYELVQQIQKAEEATKLRSRFISVVAHEFRNPLSIVSAVTQLLQRGEGKLTAEKRRALLDRVQIAVGRLTRLMDGLLAFNKNISSQIKFNPQSVNLESCCTAIITDIQLFHKNMYEINFQTEGDCSDVFVDATLITTILNNLLSNALKYSPDDSPVSLRLKRKAHQLIIEVNDSGQGIPAEDQSTLFEAFFRARNVGDIEGTGLGLSIVKQCVDLHQGSIEVQSEVGRGTTFIVSLPLQSVSPAYDTVDRLERNLS